MIRIKIKIKKRIMNDYYKKRGYNVLEMDLGKNTNIKPLIDLTNKIMEEIDI